VLHADIHPEYVDCHKFYALWVPTARSKADTGPTLLKISIIHRPSVKFTSMSYSVLHDRLRMVRLMSTLRAGPNPDRGKSFPLLQNVQKGPGSPP